MYIWNMSKLKGLLVVSFILATLLSRPLGLHGNSSRMSIKQFENFCRYVFFSEKKWLNFGKLFF